MNLFDAMNLAQTEANRTGIIRFVFLHSPDNFQVSRSFQPDTFRIVESAYLSLPPHRHTSKDVEKPWMPR